MPGPTPNADLIARRRLLPRIELRLLLTVTGCAAGLWLFLAILDEVQERGTQAFDRMVLLWFRMPGNINLPIGPRWVQEMARDLTALGGFTALILFGIIATLVLVLKRRRVEALVFGGTLVATQVVASTLKSLISRPRPDFVAHLDLVTSSSFPSGHSTLAPVFYLTLCAIVASAEPQRSVRVVMMVTALLLVAVIGVSRVYLGVHWPTDVLAGWSLGGTIALAATALLRHLRRAAS